MIDYVFDHLGLLAWIFVSVVAGIDLMNGKINRGLKVVLLGVGVSGVLLDSLLLSFYVFLDFRNGWMFDSLGIIVFPYIIFVAYRDLKDKKISRWVWTKWMLLIVGILGLFANLLVLFNYVW